MLQFQARVRDLLLRSGLSFLCALLTSASFGDSPDQVPPIFEPLPLHTISMPEGFQISVYARVENARSMVMSPEGTLYVGTREAGNVYAIRDINKDYVADEVLTIATGLNMPNGVDLLKGDLYVSEVSRILRFAAIENNLRNPPKPAVVNDSFPNALRHGWKFIKFGPDGKLYVPVGAPCDTCLADERFSAIFRLNPDGSGKELFARGIRNTVGFDWHPITKELWFTENGRDWLGNETPPDEINHAPQAALHFGYPHCHGFDVIDSQFGFSNACASFTKPKLLLESHVAALGMEFYEGKQFPGSYKNQIFVAEHGSWNRDVPVGYRITLVTQGLDGKLSSQVFAHGWLQANGEAWGRPVDVEVMSDGSLLVSDDEADAIYRITYGGNQ